MYGTLKTYTRMNQTCLVHRFCIGLAEITAKNHLQWRKHWENLNKFFEVTDDVCLRASSKRNLLYSSKKLKLADFCCTTMQHRTKPSWYNAFLTKSKILLLSIIYRIYLICLVQIWAILSKLKLAMQGNRFDTIPVLYKRLRTPY